MENNRGITIAGNILVDKIKMIEVYPDKGMLVNIGGESMAVGGCVPNTIIDLAKIDGSLKLRALGRVGKDTEGKFVVSKMREHGVDVSKIGMSGDRPTSYTDVMTVTGSGERTFFHSRGANTEFCVSDIDVDGLDCDIFHIGYILLLDELDREDAEFGTALARVLNAVQNRGIRTSVDVVSESSDRFKRIVSPAIRYCDYLIINEIEAGEIVGISAKDESGGIDVKNIERISHALMDMGVREKVIIHCPECGFCMDSDRRFTVVPSLMLPKGFIKGAVGAGDAFCACCLYAIYNGLDDEEMLRFASCGAACNLSEADSVSGMRSKAEIYKLEDMFCRGKLEKSK